MENPQSGQDILKSTLEQLKESANARTVFGEPQKVGEKVVIPVAKIKYMFGAGAGSPPEGETAKGGGGAGGGGLVCAKPVAVVEITPEHTKVIPIIDLTKFLMRFLFMWMMVVCIIAMRRRRWHARKHMWRRFKHKI